ncbi:MAG TPA: tetratricopeptide repeat protein [Salinivirga sp.]|uniref:SH3 domain-containing protein n=1 Tax=Salinivirga sp. TaxID=1970192 RepID=UPI002B469AF3|nr:tetratricopeptide repeat protein [Salinivirga sp.]HKK58127.1 tetratricopeptide repeat protein [Salinivirga sp.]
MMTKKLITYIVTGWFAIVMAMGATPQENEAAKYKTWIDSAEAAYTNQDYSKAADFYQQVLEHGMTSADLHYNLGNAWYKQGALPQAILHYEKALKYNPAHEDARFNLQMANSLITDRIEPSHVPFYKRWYKQLWQSMPIDSWAVLSIVAFLALIGAILLFVFTRSIALKKTVVPIGLLGLVLMILSLTLGAEARSYLEDTHKAIVFEPTLNVKSSPDNSGTDLFTIHEGLKVEVRQELGEWSEIEIADGRVGWVPNESFKKV